MKTIVVRKLAIDKGLLPSLGLPHDSQEKLILDIRNRLQGHHASGLASHEGSIRYYTTVLSGNRLWHVSLDINSEGFGLILSIA